jgi:hypothetical protein
MIRRPRTLSPMNEAPPRARSSMALPSGLTSSLTSTLLPGDSAMISQAGVPMLAMGSRLGEVSSSLPELPRRLSSFDGRGPARPDGGRRSSGYLTGLSLGGMTGESEWGLRRRERKEEAQRFAQRHLENW